MPDTSPDIAALIGSRICHDLISPIGAINNGLELLGMAGDVTGPELGLISESVENASARIRFFRLAFGAASTQPVPNSEVKHLLNDATRNIKAEVVWNVLEDRPRNEVRLALLAEQCLETSMPFGGEIMISHDASGWSLRGSADKFKIDSDLWMVLADGRVPTDLAPSHVHFALLTMHCRDEGRSLNSEIGQDEISIKF